MSCLLSAKQARVPEGDRMMRYAMDLGSNFTTTGKI